MAEIISIIIVAIFFLIIFLVGVVDRKNVTLEDYWVNSRKTSTFVLAATTISTFIGVGSLISNAGVAFSGGGFGTLLIMGSFFFYLWLFAEFFAPKIKEFGDKTGAYTLPDYLEYRYSRKVRILGQLVILLTHSFSLSLQMLGMGIFVSALGGINATMATVIGGLIVIAYTTVGGLRADIRTDVVQFVVMLSLLFVFVPILFIKGGGIPAISTLPTSFLIGTEFAPWYVFILGFLFLGATNLASSDLWQRAYAGESVKTVKNAMRISSVMVFLFLIAGTLFGVFGKILLPLATPNSVVPGLLQLYLSPVLYGIIIAAFFAAIMSSADTVLLIMSMTIVHDFYQKTFNHQQTPEQILKKSRIVTFVMGTFSLCIALLIFNVVDIAIDAVSFPVVLIPAIVFGFYGIYADSTAAAWSIALGLLTIIAFLFIDPVQAFIPGVVVSFVSYGVVLVLKKRRYS